MVFGATGYIGQAIASEMDRREIECLAPGHELSFHGIFSAIEDYEPELVINCAAFIQKSSVDLNKNYPGETILGNVVFPSMLSNACEALGIPLMHVSTGCLFDEKREYSETDAPLRGFHGYCGFYIGTKLLSEEVVRNNPRHYILRIRLPFDQISHPRNYLNKMLKYPEIWHQTNSLTHRGDFAKAALDLWNLRAPFGTYHCVNPGEIKAAALAAMLADAGLRKGLPHFGIGSGGGCRLSSNKLTVAGVRIRRVEEAIEDSITNWVPNV